MGAGRVLYHVRVVDSDSVVATVHVWLSMGLEGWKFGYTVTTVNGKQGSLSSYWCSASVPRMCYIQSARVECVN